jgi:lipopolysaccharide/colanic/teichoic acid biosynthesis glycosyltransferase
MRISTELTATEAPPAPALCRLHPGVLPAPAGWGDWAKQAADVVLASLLLIPALPLIMVAAVLIKLTSRGPVFYSQTRLGKDGRPYVLWKLRTMVHNCEALTGPRWAMPDDPRVIPVGRLLRELHLDELPQLWNVLCGDMSLVGPRPERPEFVPQLDRAIPHYRQRLRVRPGITGLAQVQLPADTDLDSVRRKLAYDLYYVRHQNAWLDLKLIACTALKLFRVPFSLYGPLLGIPHGEAVESAFPSLQRPEVFVKPTLSQVYPPSAG